MSISIELSHKVTTTDNGTVKLELVCTATGITEKVFAIELLPRSADKLTNLYRFSHVCSPAELVEFPDTVPGDNCYFRISEMEMLFDTPVTAGLVLDNIKHDIRKLVREYKELEEQQSVTGVEIFS